MQITQDIYDIGVNDTALDLFEGQYDVPNGMSYNSYVIQDEKIAVLDTVDRNFKHEWLDRLQEVIGDKAPDYLVIQHMEPDHSANIKSFVEAYPQVTLVASAKAFAMMAGFFGSVPTQRQLVIAEGSTLSLGKHELLFVAAPMVHWPEVMVTYDRTDKVLFSADAFGKFGAKNVDDDWVTEARRYYFGIVGKYGVPVQQLLKKAETLDIQTICPLHGPVLTENLSKYFRLYSTWSAYEPEQDGILLVYSSVYGNTKHAVLQLAEQLKTGGCPVVTVRDLARCDLTEAVGEAFRYSKLVLASVTYNGDIFPHMRQFIEHLVERNYTKRTVAFVENGSWAPLAAKKMRAMLDPCKELHFCETTPRILSALNDESRAQLIALGKELCAEYASCATVEKAADLSALFRIGYGLYVVTTQDEQGRDNGLIVNTVTQVTNAPNRLAVTLNKESYSHHLIRLTNKLNVNCLTVDTPFAVFERFGFSSGRNTDKFAGEEPSHSANRLAILPQYSNAYLSLQVEQYVDLGTHGMFICAVTDAAVLSDHETMTYTYYQEHVKPVPKNAPRQGYICKVCGYVYEGETLPADFICPVCKHGAADFEKLS